MTELPPLQQQSDVLCAAHSVVTDRFDEQLQELSLAQLHALKTRVIARERQLLTTRPPDDLFCSAQPTTQPGTVPTRSQGTLTLVEYARLREELTALDEIVSTRTTADLVATIRKHPDEHHIPGRRRGKNPLPATIRHVAGMLKLTGACVDRRLTAAAALWPKQQYRRTKLHVPRLAAALSRGEIPLTTAMIAHDKLNEIRQSVRRAGGDAQLADDLVAHSEQKLLPQAQHNNPHVFGKYAKGHSDGIRHELIGPRQVLTEDQVRHEKGLFYHRPIGDKLHCLQLVVDDGQLLQLEAFREFGTSLNSSVATLRATAHAAENPRGEDALLHPADPSAGDDVENNPRITPEDIDLGIAQLFDGQTRAERWLNTVFDFLSSGLLLHKTYDPGAGPEQQVRRGKALYRAAEYSETVADILALSQPDDGAVNGVGGSDPPDDPLKSLVPPGYQLLRPNLDVMVELTLRDLVGLSPGDDPATGSRATGPELTAIIEYLKTQDRGARSPSGTPGDVAVDLGIARQLACDQRIIPVVLGTASQPLNVGRARRSFTAGIRRALLIRDRGCVVPTCTVPGVWCVPHHVVPWSQGGSSALENAALVCRHHHAAIHDGLISVRLEPDGLPSCSLSADSQDTDAWYRNSYWQR